MLAQHVKDILVESALESHFDNEVVLKAVNRMQVSVVGIPLDAVVINMDRIGSPRYIKNGPWQKFCDYVIIFQSREQDGVLFVELKRTLRGNTDGHEQLRRSLPILDYLERICAIHFETDRAHPEVHYVLIGERANRRLDKQRVRAGQVLPVEQYKDIAVTSVLGPRVAFKSMRGT